MRSKGAGLLRVVVRAGVTVAAIAGVSGVLALARVGIHQGYEPEQPIAFSHELHAGTSGISCLYCHFGATRSRHAGIPPAAVCMNCHAMLTKRSRDIERLKEAVEHGRPIVWTAVHVLPDYVYFSHSRHLAADVACESCHGPVASMARVRQDAPLTMGWCLDCHRQRADLRTTRSLECSSCHY